MLKKISATLALALGLATVGTARADCDGVRCESVKVEVVYLQNQQQRLLIGTSGTETNLDNCTPDENRWLAVPKSAPMFEQIYALVLAAQLSGKSVNLRTVDTTNATCTVAWATMQ